MTVAEALRLAERELAAAGIETPRVDAELLLAHVLDTSRSGVYAHAEEQVPGTWQVLLGRRVELYLEDSETDDSVGSMRGRWTGVVYPPS